MADSDTRCEPEEPGIVETHALTRRLGEIVAVDSVSLDVRLREIFGLIGPNEPGKSTHTKMLTSLPPSGFRVSLSATFGDVP